MKPNRVLIAVGAFLLTLPLQARSLVKFKAGTPAVADSINANFELLNSRIDSVAKNNGAGGTADLAAIRKSLDTAYLGYKTSTKVVPSLYANYLTIKSTSDTGQIIGPHINLETKGLYFHYGPSRGFYFGLDDKTGVGINYGGNSYLAVRNGYMELPMPVNFSNGIRFKPSSSGYGFAGSTFSKQNSLLPVDSLAGYIAAAGVLPGFPAQAEIDADGLDLMDVNKLLVKKIEEMTLYIINQEVRIKALEAKP